VGQDDFLEIHQADRVRQGDSEFSLSPPRVLKPGDDLLGDEPEADSFPAFSAMRAGSIAPERRYRKVRCPPMG
jgi:hypothetical protein